MSSISKFGGVLVALFFAVMWAAPAQAQATRTWVSGVGDDVNPCSRTAPCKTFPGAISKTAVNGEINCLDPAGYGAVTITKSMAIICPYTEGGLLVAVGNGVTVNAAGGTVYLSGLDFEGNGTSSIGVSVLQAASVTVTNCLIRGFNTSTAAGINFAPSTASKLFVYSSVLTGNGTGATGGGIVIQPASGGSVKAIIADSHLDNNTSNGLSVTSIVGSLGSNVTVRDSTTSGNGGTGVAAAAPSGTQEATIWLDHVTTSNNAIGISVSGINLADVLVNNSAINRNTTGLSFSGTGVINTYGDNRLLGNGSDGSFTGPVVGKL